MPVFKDLEELIRHLISKQEEELKQIEQEIKREIAEVENFIKSSSPLYSVEELQDCYKYVIDMPKADTSSLKITTSENTIRVYCKTKSGNTYYLKFTIPPDADPNSVEVTRHKWLIVITVKKKQ